MKYFDDMKSISQSDLQFFSAIRQHEAALSVLREAGLSWVTFLYLYRSGKLVVETRMMDASGKIRPMSPEFSDVQDLLLDVAELHDLNNRGGDVDISIGLDVQSGRLQVNVDAIENHQPGDATKETTKVSALTGKSFSRDLLILCHELKEQGIPFAMACYAYSYKAEEYDFAPVIYADSVAQEKQEGETHPTLYGRPILIQQANDALNRHGTDFAHTLMYESLKPHFDSCRDEKPGGGWILIDVCQREVQHGHWNFEARKEYCDIVTTVYASPQEARESGAVRIRPKMQG